MASFFRVLVGQEGFLAACLRTCSLSSPASCVSSSAGTLGFSAAALRTAGFWW